MPLKPPLQSSAGRHSTRRNTRRGVDENEGEEEEEERDDDNDDAASIASTETFTSSIGRRRPLDRLSLAETVSTNTTFKNVRPLFQTPNWSFQPVQTKNRPLSMRHRVAISNAVFN